MPAKFKERRTVWLVGMGLLLAAGLASTVAASEVKVRLRLPVRARLDLSGHDTITIAPCMVVSSEGDEEAWRGEVDVQREFERYASRLLSRRTPLKVVESGPIDYPTYDLEVLARDPDFWAFVGERTQADLILACSLDFDVQDKSGYVAEEVISPFDGRTYYRQVLVENTGFEFDILLQVLNGRTGELLHSDNFKDFKQFEGESADPVMGMFSNLYSLEDRIAGIFAVRQIETTRTLFTD